jgi:hypothetical protein
MSIALILTATIQPKGMSHVAIGDATLREQQYLEAFAAVLQLSTPNLSGLVFAENSAADLGKVRELARRHQRPGREVEVLGIDTNNFPRHLGKGYGEFLLLDEVMAQSTIARRTRHLGKLTGRLRVRNLERIIAHLPPEFDVAADIHPSLATPVEGVVDTRLFFFSSEFYSQRVRAAYLHMDDSRGIYAEHIIYQLVRQSAGMTVVPRLPHEPDWAGTSGSMGVRYDGVANRLKYPLKVFRRWQQRMRGFPDLRTVFANAGEPWQKAPPGDSGVASGR